MSFPLAGLGSSAASTATTATGGRTDINRDQFLQLLVTQLKHQDPLSPLQPDQFAAQLAQFATVEQLNTLNDHFTAQSAAQAQGALVDQTALGASLMGRTVQAQGNGVAVGSNGIALLPVDVGGSGGSATVHFYDGTGRLVATKAVGQVAAGSQTLSVAPGLPAGNYTYDVQVDDGSGNAVPATTFMQGVVDGVLFENGAIVLRVGGTKVPLTKVTEITN